MSVNQRRDCVLVDVNRIPYHWPGAGCVAPPSPFESPPTVSSWIDVKVIGSEPAPVADSVPLTVSMRVWPLNLTTTPGEMVSVAPADTEIEESRM